MEKNLKILRNKIMILSKKIIKEKYGDCNQNYNKHKIFDILFSRNSKFVIKYKEVLIYNCWEEFNKRYYQMNESNIKLIKILKYYLNYLTFFCRPIFVEFYYNNILQNYYDIKADIFYRKNYLKKGEEEEYLKNFTDNNDEDEKIKDSDLEINKFSNLVIFDDKIKDFIETSSNVLTSIAQDNNDINESYRQKIQLSNDKFLTIKNNDDYLNDLIRILNTKKKEKKPIVNQNFNLNYSFFHNKNKSSKNKKSIKKNIVIFNSNKNTIENNFYTNFNITCSKTKKKISGKSKFKKNSLNSNKNFSDIKIKYINNSQKKAEKSLNKNLKNINGSDKRNNIKNLDKKFIINNVSANKNNIKPGLFNLYKRSSINIKSNNFKNKNFINKKTSFSIYKNNNSNLNSQSNIYNKNYNSNSNSPTNKNIINDNKSDIINFSGKNRPTKKEVKQNLYNNLTIFFSHKKNLQKQLIKNLNNNNVKNNIFFNDNTNCLNNVNQNKKCITLYKKINFNNSLSKNKLNNPKNSNKIKINNEIHHKKKYSGNYEHNLFINYLANYFNLKYLKSKSLLKTKTKVSLNNPENLNTFSVRIKKQNKNHSTSGYLSINKKKPYFNNMSFSNITKSKINNCTNIYQNQNNKFKNSSKKKLFKISNNNSIEKLQKNDNIIQNLKLLYKKYNNNNNKSGVNLNVNFNLNNINININSSSSNHNTCTNINNIHNKISDKLNKNILNNNINYSQIKKKNSSFKSRNKIKNKISRKNIEKLLNNIIINKNNYANYKKNILVKNKKKNNISFNQSGGNKTINLINKNQIVQDKPKIIDDNKRINSFIYNKEYNEINYYKKKEINKLYKYSIISIKKK